MDLCSGYRSTYILFPICTQNQATTKKATTKAVGTTKKSPTTTKKSAATTKKPTPTTKKPTPTTKKAANLVQVYIKLFF